MHRIFEKRKLGRWLLVFALAALVVIVPSVVLAQATGGASTAGAASSGSGGITSSLTNSAITFFAGLLAWFLGIVMNFLGKLILLLVNILLGFLTYNDFAHAAPVEIGWKILRDLSNMFFIVILLICAFSTIVGYNHDFHIRKVLPKLLFTAVTINFSKTLVGLMIDASQVVMLTFVNAFQAVGVGNFVNALHLQNISALAPAADSQTNILIEVILSYMLAVMMLVLSIGIILIMIIFVVGRIVGLWMSMIFAPLAFLMGALPGKMSEKVGKLSKDYWPRLNGLLFGGPTIAFFLWLTFATVNSLDSDQSLNIFRDVTTNATGGTSAVNSAFSLAQEGAVGFITRIGSVRNLASYLIAVTMLMLGLDAAMDAMSSVGGIAKDWASTVNKKTREYATKAAVAPYSMAWGATKGVTRGVGNFIDRRVDATGRLAAGLRTIPLVDRFAGDKLRKMQFARRKEWEEQKQARFDDYKKATRPEEKEAAKKRAEFAAKSSPLFGHQGDQLGYAAILEAEGSQEKFAKRSKELAKPLEDQISETMKKNGNFHPPVAKNLATQQANQQAFQERLESLNGALRVLDPKRDKETYEKIEDQIKQIKKENPAYITDAEDRKKAMAGVAANLSNLTDEQTSDLEVLFNSTNEELRDQAFSFDKASGKYAIKDPIALSQMVASHKGKPTEKKFDALVSFMKNSPSGVTMDQMRNYSIQKGKDDSYGVYQKADGARVVTEKQQVAENALKDRIQTPAAHGRGTGPGGKPFLDYDEDEKDLNKAPAGNAVLAAIPHLGIAEVMNRAGDKDGAVTNLLREQFRDSGTVVNQYAEDYEKSKDYIEIYNDGNSTDQEKFFAQSEFQKDFQRVQAIIGDVPSSSIDPDKRLQLMEMMDESRADRFLTAPSNMLIDEKQKKIAMNVKEMAKTMAGDVYRWREANVEAANSAAVVVQDVPAWKRMQRLERERTAGTRVYTKEEDNFVKTVKAKAEARLKAKGLLDAGNNIIQTEVDKLSSDSKVQEGIKYTRAANFIRNVTRENKKNGSGRRR